MWVSACWGANDEGQTDVPATDLVVVAAGGDSSCGVTTAGELLCWGVAFAGAN